MKIKFPREICSDYVGYEFFVELHNRTKDKKFISFEFDFSHTTWFEANLCAILGSIINRLQTGFNEVVFLNLKENIADVFNRNHFRASFGGVKIPDSKETTIKYRKNKLTDEKLIKEFLYSELLQKREFPKLSPVAKREIARSIFEIYSNAIIHGDCEYVYSCGQYFPKKTPPRIDFTIVDMGKTIKMNVNEFLKTQKTGEESILWAVEANNSTKPKENNIPGGLGLKLITEFVELNYGKLQIISSDGFWELKKKKIEVNTFNYEFPGTIVNIEFNLDDKSSYSMKSEKVEDIIF
jgi:hypothetical protein